MKVRHSYPLILVLQKGVVDRLQNLGEVVLLVQRDPASALSYSQSSHARDDGHLDRYF